MKGMDDSLESRESRIVIDTWLTRRGVKQSKLSAFGRIIGLTEKQARIKYKEPWRLTIKEIRRMKLSDSDVVRLVKGVKG